MSSFRAVRTVLFGDCDPAGVIYTPRVADYLVEAILEFQTERFGGSASRRYFEMGVLPPARQLSIEFLTPLTWDDRIEIEVRCAEIGTTSFTCEVEARRVGGGVAFRGSMTQVCVARETRRPVPLPQALRDALAE